MAVNVLRLSDNISADALAKEVLAALADGDNRAALAKGVLFTSMYGQTMPESYALTAIALERAGLPAQALRVWDALVTKFPRNSEWISRAIQRAWALASAKSQTWLTILTSLFLSPPPTEFLTALAQRGVQRLGSCGIHRGEFHAWIWLPVHEKFQVRASHDAPKIELHTSRTTTTATHILISLSATLPSSQHPYALSITDASGQHITNSPLQISPKESAAPSKKLGKRVFAPKITIVLPVYDDRVATLTTLASIFASQKHCHTPHRLLVCWDCGPDKQLLASLRQLAIKGKIELLEQTENKGFLATVNTALSRIPSGDIVLLNADTLVHGDWIDRIAMALSDKTVGTVTVLGSDAELLSYPSFAERADVRHLRDVALLDTAAASVQHPLVTIPVGVGFCMGIARRALDRVLGLDGLLLCQGYGEEVDFCLRVAAAGFTNCALTNVFVAHTGNRSFGPRKKALVAQNNKAIFAEHPDYQRDYNAFVTKDPLKSAKEELTRALFPLLPAIPTVRLRPWAEQWYPVSAAQKKSPALDLFVLSPRELRLRRSHSHALLPLSYVLPRDLELLTKDLHANACTQYEASTLCDASIAEGLGLTPCQDKSAQASVPLSPHPLPSKASFLVVPPGTLAEWQDLSALASRMPDALFWVTALREIWGDTLAPDNIRPLTLQNSITPLCCTAVLVPNRLLSEADNVAQWLAWLDEQELGECPWYTVRGD